MKTDKYGKTSLTFGILSVIPIFGVLGIVFAILGIVYSNKQKKLGPSKKARNGMILSIIGIFISAIATVVQIGFLGLAALLSAASY